ncbi:COR domain-containing protein [Pseudophaeobacter arcticus]|uniref:COR domain-containing protein n=1 Tax=Pseudophaeobacter arcticus TaxID=385492 RepID=UPI003A97C773
MSGLARLQSLNFSGLEIPEAHHIRDLIRKNEFLEIKAYRTRIRGIPDEVLSSSEYENCVERLDAHFNDLGDDPQVLDAVKLIVLGNGRIGKTQICNRLRGKPFEASADSTHGIQLVNAPIPEGKGSFRVWDFGGQEIYHGTHALFFRTRAVFLLVWTPETDNSDEDFPAHGMQFRNRPVEWWLNFVSRFKDRSTPLVVVQNQIDREGAYDHGDHPAVALRRENFDYCRSLAMSASTGEGLASLNERLKFAADRFNPPLVGAGRLAVMKTLQKMLEEDQAKPSEDRQNRTLTMSEFCDLCENTGGISSPRQFLSFLHNAGELFWLSTQDADIIILDQAWALEAIYAIYDRERKCWANLLQNRGRFSRQIMGSFIWDAQGYKDEEQQLFVSFMCQSGICFMVSGREDDDSAVYIAPDALPENLGWEHPASFAHPDKEHFYWFDQVFPGFMRALLVASGHRAGINGTYWRNGFSGYDERLQARVRIEKIHDEEKGHGLHLSVQGPHAADLLGSLCKLSERVMEQFSMAPKSLAPIHSEGCPDVEYGPDPYAPRSFFVSYAWGDNDAPGRAQIVDEFCARAEEEGTHIRRDKNEIGLGQSISEFMEKLVEGDRILLVLTDKYLHSVPCMTELYNVWHHAGHNPEQFLLKVRLFVAPDAKIFDPVGRGLIGKYWHDEYESQKPVLNFMGDRDRVAHNQLKRFYTHVPDILELISDRLLPRSLDDLLTYALD